MEWPSGSLCLVGDFELRIIPRGGSKMYLSPWWALSSIQVSCCYQESIWDHSWPIRFGYGRKSMPEAFPNAARIWVSILDGMYLGLTGQKTLRCVDLSVPREGFRRSSFSSRRMSFYFEFLL